jgi:hypothetical protein
MTKTTKDIITIVAVLAFAVLAVIFGPLLTLWALNTLFPVLAIPYNFYSWLAVVLLNLTLRSSVSFKKD